MKARPRSFLKGRKLALVQYFKDDATAFNAQKKDVIKGKGAE